MKKIKHQIILDKVKEKIQGTMNSRVALINKEMDECPDDVPDHIAEKIANEIIGLASLNDGKILINTIKITEKKEG